MDLSTFLRRCLTDERLQRFDEVVNERTRHISIVLENIHHAHNASACLRTCDCFGIQDVHIVEDCNAFEPNEDIALGSDQWLTIQRYKSKTAGAAASECIQNLRNAGFRILATSPRQNSTPLPEINVDQKMAIIFGAEQVGVSDTAFELADELIHIPMYGFTESFNISVSAALCLQQLTRQLRESDIDWQLSAEERSVITEEWVRSSLGHKLEPLLRRYEQEFNSPTA